MPAHKRGPWTPQEDACLLELVRSQGAHNWVRISTSIETRSPKQCRERFHQNLKPNLNHLPITQEEGEEIERLVAEMGKRWAEIARRLHGRSDNAVKNWWNGGLNRRKRGSSRRYEATHQHHDAHYPQREQSHPFVHPYAEHHQHLSNAPVYQQHNAYYAQPYQRKPWDMEANRPMAPVRHSHTYDTPLPSPSAYSVDGHPPSMISDNSSTASRSPHEQLPPLLSLSSNRSRPLSGSLDPYQHATTPRGEEHCLPPMQMSKSQERHKQAPMRLQEGYYPHTTSSYRQPLYPAHHHEESTSPTYPHLSYQSLSTPSYSPYHLNHDQRSPPQPQMSLPAFETLLAPEPYADQRRSAEIPLQIDPQLERQDRPNESPSIMSVSSLLVSKD